MAGSYFDLKFFLINFNWGSFTGPSMGFAKIKINVPILNVEMFYLNTIEQLFLFVEQLDQLEVCLPYSRLLTGIPILAVFQNLRWNSNKTPLYEVVCNVM